MRKLFTIFFLLLSNLVCAQQHVYVSVSGSDDGDGTVNRPYHTLAKAFEGNMSTDRLDTLY